MAGLVLQLVLLLSSIGIIRAHENMLGAAVGSAVAVAVVIELVTILIAVCCCVSLKRKLKKSTAFAKSSREQNSTRSRVQEADYEEYNEEDGNKTIRVVHNTLYESMRSENGGNMSPVQLEDMNDAVAGREGTSTADTALFQESGRLQVQHDLTKERSRTESSHAYEPIISGDFRPKAVDTEESSEGGLNRT